MKRILAVLLSAALLLALCVPAFAEEAQTAAPYADSAFFTYGDYTIHYRVKQAAEPRGQILMLHGFAQSTAAWENMAALLTENGYTCVLADLPDFLRVQIGIRLAQKLFLIVCIQHIPLGGAYKAVPGKILPARILQEREERIFKVILAIAAVVDL